LPQQFRLKMRASRQDDSAYLPRLGRVVKIYPSSASRQMRQHLAQVARTTTKKARVKRDKEATDPFEMFPTEVLSIIFGHLDLEDLHQCWLVNTTWQRWLESIGTP